MFKRIKPNKFDKDGNLVKENLTSLINYSFSDEDMQKFIEDEIYLVKFYQRTSISMFKENGYKYRLDLIKDIEMMSENNYRQSISRFDEFESGQEFSSASEVANPVNKMTFSNLRYKYKFESKSILKIVKPEISDYKVFLIPPKSPELKLNSLPIESNMIRAKSIGYSAPRQTKEISDSESISDNSSRSVTCD